MAPTGSALLTVVLWEVARNLTSHVRIKGISEICALLMMTATQDVVSSDFAHPSSHANFKRCKSHRSRSRKMKKMRLT